LRVALRALLLAAGLALTGVGWLGLPAPADAQSIFTGDAIGDIRVEGTQRVEPETVLSYMKLQPGDPFAADRIDKALKNLFDTGLFADVTFRREGNTLVVKVVENPIIDKIAFEGNDHLDDKDLLNEIQLKPRTVLTQSRVQEDTTRILNLYRRDGRFGATVDPKIIKLDQNRVNLVFEIKEGKKTEVRRISFVGNKAFSDSTLRGEIETTVSAWYRFLSTTDSYDPDRLQVDRDKLRDFYLSEGYIDFKVVSAVAELSPEQDAFYITFTVDEGERYRVGKVAIKSTLRNLDTKSLEKLVETKTGDWYDQLATDQTVQAMNDALGTLGYAFVDIRPRLDREPDPKKKIVDITYNINEGPKVYVERIDIKGNVRTLDTVIRREFRLVEGDAFNTAKLQRTRQRLENLGFFSSVDIKTLPGSAPDKTVIEVNVAEQSTGELSFGLGYSTTNGPLGLAGIRERNLLGRGQDLQLNLSLSGVRSQVVLSFTEPYFLGRPIAAGFDIFDTRTSARNNLQFTEKDLGLGLRAGYDISEYLRHTVHYTLSRQEITDVASTASLAIQQSQGVTVNSLIGNEFLYDRRDNRLTPTQGYYIRLRNDLSTFPGTLSYVGTRLGGGYYLPLNRSHSVYARFSGEIGYLQDLGKSIPIINSYELGGDTFRGFESNGIGPRDSATGDSLGGKEYGVGTVQVTFPLGLPAEYQITGHFFSDFGTLTSTDANISTIQDSASLRLSAGFGLDWKSPFGPLSIDLAYPVLKQSFDKTQIINFSVGTSF
jgi:outer membrane protein insertion porin family